MNRWWPRDRPVERLVRCTFGLFLFGVGVAVLIDADLGAAPWDVFHVGLSRHIPFSVGQIIIGTGVALLLLWIPLRERPGLGTVLNAVEIGVVVDLISPLIPEVDAIPGRLVMMIGAILLIAIGSGFYIGAGLGPGPRDGLMTGLAKRGISVRLARTFIELVVMVAGVVLGGTIGIGTVAFMFGIGPLVQIFLPRLSIDHPTATPLPAAASRGVSPKW